MISWQAFLWKAVIRASFKKKDFSRLSAAQSRTYFRRTMSWAGFIPKGLVFTSAGIGGVAVEIVTDPSRPTPDCCTVLYLHGGGYYMGSPETHRSLTAHLARHVPATVVVPDYRLAPEYRFPAALDDALSVYRALIADETVTRPVILAGDSAGGGLALALMLALKRHGEPLPACVVTFSPWTDLTATGDSMVRNAAVDPMLDPKGVGGLVRNYLGPDGDPRNPLVSPLFGTFDGAPPLLVQVSDIEILLDDSRRLAERAAASGVPVVLDVTAGMPHVWQLLVGRLPEARRSLDVAAAFIRRHANDGPQAP